MSSPSRQTASPWPVQTPAPPQYPASVKRKRHPEHRPSSSDLDFQPRSWLTARDDIANPAAVAKAENDCEFNVPNNVFSCFPNEDTVVPQHQWLTFVWNSRLPQFTQTNLVNIFLFHGDSQEQVLNFTNEINPSDRAGYVTAQVNDTWFGSQGANWNGDNITYPMFWLISPNTQSLDGSQLPQPTFAAVQTTYADYVAASISSASSASAASASSASAAAASSSSAASVSAAHGSSGSGTATGTTPGSGSLGTSSPGASSSSSAGSGSGSVQSDASSGFPHWAIAVIVVLGFLALVASGILAFFITRRIRNRRNSTLSHRGSMGSSTPMMAHAQTGNVPTSPLLAGAILGGGAAASQRPVSPVDMQDGASTMSRTSDAAPFSGADAAIMADAFRQALRKPDFAERPTEDGNTPEDGSGEERPAILLSQELAEEGRDIRSVGSSRGVRVETLSDDGAPLVQDNPH
ncbi:hypothetical protein B0H21DRAFT_135448 [Amylocystis lapponica]|nr:hypothetical protein B0H21DRAFT_135448 [Amylocystis lapponica]